MNLNEALINENENKKGVIVKDLLKEKEDLIKEKEELIKEEKIKYYSTEGDIYSQSNLFSKIIFYWAFRIIRVINNTLIIV